jgi:hypothetical protein
MLAVIHSLAKTWRRIWRFLVHFGFGGGDAAAGGAGAAGEGEAAGAAAAVAAGADDFNSFNGCD